MQKVYFIRTNVLYLNTFIHTKYDVLKVANIERLILSPTPASQLLARARLPTHIFEIFENVTFTLTTTELSFVSSIGR